jgi:hypothetical protein
MVGKRLVSFCTLFYYCTDSQSGLLYTDGSCESGEADVSVSVRMNA